MIRGFLVGIIFVRAENIVGSEIEALGTRIGSTRGSGSHGGERKSGTAKKKEKKSLTDMLGFADETEKG